MLVTFCPHLTVGEGRRTVKTSPSLELITVTDNSTPEKAPENDRLHSPDSPDPTRAHNVVCIAGLVGGSSRQGVFRLYTTPDMREFFEIREDQVRKYRTLDKSESPLGGSLLWVDADEQLLRVSSEVISANSAAQSARPEVT